jgi:Terpene synthase family 2, C-terminal metal binding
VTSPLSASSLPRLRSPFPSSLHPQVGIAEAATLEWADRFGLAEDPAVRRRLAATRSARLAGRVSPRATLPGLLLNTDWQTWLFLFDDAFCDESELGARPTAMIGLAAQVLAVVETGQVPPTEPGPVGAFLAALADLRDRLAALATPGQLARFTAAVTGYLLALTWEAAHREAGVPASLREYQVMRRHSGAVPTCLALIEVVNGFELPERVVRQARLDEVSAAAADATSWANDILSYPKEVRRSTHVLSLPAVLAREYGISAAQALREAAALYDERLRAYQELEAPLLAEGNPLVNLYLADLRAWIAGNLAWSYETGRYGLGIAA